LIPGRDREYFLNAITMKPVLGTIRTHILFVLEEAFFESKVGWRLKLSSHLRIASRADENIWL
jgi:hypothetical protein